MREAISMGNTQKKSKKRMDGHFFDLLRLLKKRQKQDSFSAQFKQHFNYTTSHTDLRKCMKFKVVKQINTIGAMEKFKKFNCNSCMKERLNSLKIYMKNASLL